MTIQNYLEVDNNTNIVINNVSWDGDTSTWQPPETSTMLVDNETLSMIWQPNEDYTGWVLTGVLGAGDIGFTWDGTVLTTNQPKSTIIPTPYNPTII
jgi:hypothetical protein